MLFVLGALVVLAAPVPAGTVVEPSKAAEPPKVAKHYLPAPLFLPCSREPFAARSGSYLASADFATPKEFKVTAWWDDHGAKFCMVIENFKKKERWVAAVDGTHRILRTPDSDEVAELKSPFAWGGQVCYTDRPHFVGLREVLGVMAEEFALAGEKTRNVADMWGGIVMRNQILQEETGNVIGSEVTQVLLGTQPEPEECAQARLAAGPPLVSSESFSVEEIACAEFDEGPHGSGFAHVYWCKKPRSTETSPSCEWVSAQTDELPVKVSSARTEWAPATAWPVRADEAAVRFGGRVRWSCDRAPRIAGRVDSAGSAGTQPATAGTQPATAGTQPAAAK